MPRWPEGGGWKAPRCVRGGDQGTRAGRPRASKWHSARTRDSSLRGGSLRALSAPSPLSSCPPPTFSARARGGGLPRAFPVLLPRVRAGPGGSGLQFRAGLSALLPAAAHPILSVETEPHVGRHQAPHPPSRLSESSSYPPVGRHWPPCCRLWSRLPAFAWVQTPAPLQSQSHCPFREEAEEAALCHALTLPRVCSSPH